MERVKYFDFDLLVERTPGGYRARVIQSPAGQAGIDFTLPFTDQDIEILMLRVGRARRGVRRLESPEMEAAKQFGGKLFDAVFAGDVRSALRASMEAANREGAGLRMRLRLADAPQLVDLPWEFLYNSSLNRFLALSNKTPLVRYIELPETPRPLKITPPLRVLVMISSPRDYEALDVEREWKQLTKALHDLIENGTVKLERLDDATLGALRRKLRQEQYHVLHFIGHGGFDTQAQDGVLLLEDEQGRGRRTSGLYLATILNDHRSLRLVVLNACEGARTARNDPFAGVAQSLVQQGLAAVIAMQFEVTDEASIKFAQEFYSAVADGYPVDAALGEARGAIFSEVNDLEWGTPVLYLRSPDGIIFAAPSAEERAELQQRRAEEQRLLEQQEKLRLAEEQSANRARERQAQIAALYASAQTSLDKNEFDAAERALAALLALDATDDKTRALQIGLRTAREQNSTTSTPVRSLGTTERGGTVETQPVQPARAAQKTEGRSQCGIVAALLVIIGVALAFVCYLVGLPLLQSASNGATLVTGQTATAEAEARAAVKETNAAEIANNNSAVDSTAEAARYATLSACTHSSSRPPALWRIVFCDNFDARTNNLFLGDYDDAYGQRKWQVISGKYQVDTIAKKGLVSESSIRDINASDLYLSVTARRLNGPEASLYGLVFRNDGSNYFVFWLSDSKGFGVDLLYNAKWTHLIAATPSRAIKTGQANRLSVLANGADLTFFINDQQVGVVNNNQLSEGTVGVAIGIDRPGYQGAFEFDDLELWTP